MRWDGMAIEIVRLIERDCFVLGKNQERKAGKQDSKV